MDINGYAVPITYRDCIVVGSGAAGYNAADWLYQLGVHDVAIVTEGRNMGTSRNTGSDKQTYYKLSISGDEPDSVAELAQTLFDGQSVNGDTAYAEAASSVKCFIKLANLGVPFPSNDFGEYVGYKTDHDPRRRATSAGPLTSRFMTEALEREVVAKGITIYDGWQAVKLLKKDDESAAGLLCVNAEGEFAVFCAQDIILATGGAAGIYQASVYPESQSGMTGMAVEAGAECVNLQEWQYGLASAGFRWNVSGTYQQVLPRYVAVSPDGAEREFLCDSIKDPAELLETVFLKGYQWPFDVRKIDGSSRVDMLVHREIFAGNRVYMDFRANPAPLSGGFGVLRGETREYLEKSGALFGTPIERLLKMNPSAAELYREHGINLETDMLEVAVCAQHQNGGVGVDADWRTTVPHLYAAGELAGTFGVYRPGGSALNSTQVGAMRAAEAVARARRTGKIQRHPDPATIYAQCAPTLELVSSALCGTGCAPEKLERGGRRKMTKYAAHIRDANMVSALRKESDKEWERFRDVKISDLRDSARLLKARDTLLARRAVLSAMEYSCEHAGSRGSALVIKDGKEVPEDETMRAQLIVTRFDGDFTTSGEMVRPIPKPEQWFENVWSESRKRS